MAESFSAGAISFGCRNVFGSPDRFSFKMGGNTVINGI